MWFWSAHWIRELGPLVNYSVNQTPTFKDATVYAMVSLNGDCNWEYFVRDLPREVLRYIAGIIPPRDDAGANQIGWKLMENGKCTMSSGYSKVAQDVWSIQDHTWKIIWKLDVPQRIRQFLWLLLHNRILSNSERCRRGMLNTNFVVFVVVELKCRYMQ